MLKATEPAESLEATRNTVAGRVHALSSTQLYINPFQTKCQHPQVAHDIFSYFLHNPSPTLKYTFMILFK